MGDAVVGALSELVPGGVARGGLRPGDGDRMVRWVEAGSGNPTVILAAGRNDTAISWAPILAALAGKTHVVAYDRAGLGASDPDPGPEPPTVDRQVADLAAVIGQTAGGPCVLVGHSWGGLLAELLARRHPDLVCGLVLVDPAHEDMTATLPGPVRRLNWSVSEHLPSLLLALGLLGPVVRWRSGRTAERFTDDPRIRSMVVDAYAAHGRRQQVRASRDELRGIAASTPLIRQAHAASSLPDVPVVVLSATRGFPPRFREGWTALQAGTTAATRGRHIVVADAGHVIHHDWPELVAEAVLEVVEEARREEGPHQAISDGGG